MHALASSAHDPLGHFWAGPAPAIRRGMLERLVQLGLLFRRQERRRAGTAPPAIRQPSRPLLAEALGDLPDRARTAAGRRLNLSQRHAIRQETDHLPMPA